jgi:hypothetical protein
MKSKGRDLYVHSKWLVVVLMMSLLGLALGPRVANAAGSTAVSVSAPTQAVAPGEQFTVSIVVVPGTSIAGMQFDLTYSASLVSASSVEEGNLLKQGGVSTFFNSGNIDNQAGKIAGVFGAVTSPGTTVSAPGTFATVTFTAKTTSGTCSLALANVVVGDVNGDSVPVSVVGGTASIDRPPVLNAIGNRNANEESKLSFVLSASDPDGGALTYSASNLPPGATFDTTTRTFSWTPGYGQAGVYADVHFEVSDGKRTDYEDITITVGNVPRPDVNDDGDINVLDMIRIGQRWSETGTSGWIREDVNDDGTISVLDAAMIGQRWTG